MPESAAVLDGAGAAFDTGLASFEQIAELGEETSRTLAATLGAKRLDELRAQGMAMKEEQAVAYARDAIARALDSA